MRLKSILAAAATTLALVFASAAPSAATDLLRGDHDRGKVRHIDHHVYYPRYVHHYKVDPYAYRYSPRGYYPYYGSHYWAPAGYVKARKRAHLNRWNSRPPRYYKSWGYPRDWNHSEWHKEHHGRHHRWHW
ncbi:MAG: hypothetical protein R3D67_01385 [Hyphomicrobiaceae bacterium]